VILAGTLHTFGLPLEGVAIILGVDELMDMARTAINVIGNCLATVVVARWEGEFDDRRARAFGTPEEVALDLREGEPAFAEAARLGD
jgi:proton glutamate symport protein